MLPCWILSMNFFNLRAVTVTNRDPYFVVPKIKSLLRKRYRLRRKGRIEKAESISQSIVDHAKVTFSPCSRGSKERWEKLRQVTGKNKSRSCLNHVIMQYPSNNTTPRRYLRLRLPLQFFHRIACLTLAGPNQIHLARS